MPTPSGLTLFDSAIGPCGLAWSKAGVCGVQLPERDAEATRERLEMRFPDYEWFEPSGASRRARDALVAHLDGKSRDLGKIELDWQVTAFRRRVYEAARRIPSGDTVTYGELARSIGSPSAARAIGQAMGNNPYPIIVPCHRVLAAGGRNGGFSAAGGAATKVCMLRIEGNHEVRLDGFEYDPFEAVAALSAADPRLAKIIDLVGPPRLEIQHTSSVFVALARAIVYQQLSGKAAATIFRRVCELLPRGERDLTAARVMALSESALRGAGLSNNKYLALRDLARRSLDGEIPSLARLRRLDDEAVIETLTPVRGIGRWTVEMMLIFRLGRPDVMAVDDLGLRQGHAAIMGRGGETDRQKLMRYAERWRPYRSVASWYLWRAADLRRKST